MAAVERVALLGDVHLVLVRQALEDSAIARCSAGAGLLRQQVAVGRHLVERAGVGDVAIPVGRHLVIVRDSAGLGVVAHGGSAGLEVAAPGGCAGLGAAAVGGGAGIGVAAPLAVLDLESPPSVVVLGLEWPPSVTVLDLESSPPSVAVLGLESPPSSGCCACREPIVASCEQVGHALSASAARGSDAGGRG